MNTDPITPSPLATDNVLHAELSHLRSSWWWLLLLGIFLALAGTAALVFPAATAMTTLAAVIFLGALLMITGASIIAAAFWAGRWSGFLVQLLVGIIYFIAGLMIAEMPGQSTVLLTLFMASLFIIGGIFRSVAALVIRFPHWGWTLLNGLITLVFGVIIYRHFSDAALWLIGTLVGIDMLFHGWSWIMLALAVRRLPATER